MALSKVRIRKSDATLRHWREAIPSDRYAYLVKDLTRLLSKALQSRLAKHSVSLGYWNFLRILWEHDGITQSDMSAMAGVKDPTTHLALRAMEKLGYITRRPNPKNLRNIEIYLTPAGKGLKKICIPAAVKVNDISVQDIPKEKLNVFREVMLLMIENLEKDELKQAR
jgi:MarR family transcriptional regulator, organic hydroperoxide resistance regulator